MHTSVSFRRRGQRQAGLPLEECVVCRNQRFPLLGTLVEAIVPLLESLF